MGQILSCCFGGKVDPNFTDSVERLQQRQNLRLSKQSLKQRPKLRQLPRVPCDFCEQQYCRFTRVFSKLSPVPEEEFDQDQSTQTTNQPEKIANGETTLKEKPNAHDAENDVKVNQPEITNGKTTLEAKSNVSGDVELPTSDPNEIIKIEREERGSSKINKQSIYAKEDPEGGAEAGKQRVREVFHMDVAELIIERDA